MFPNLGNKRSRYRDIRIYGCVDYMSAELRMDVAELQCCLYFNTGKYLIPLEHDAVKEDERSTFFLCHRHGDYQARLIRKAYMRVTDAELSAYRPAPF